MGCEGGGRSPPPSQPIQDGSIPVAMYTYAFLRSPNPPLRLPDGIAGSLQQVTAADITAIVEANIHLDDLEQSDDRLMQAVLSHDRVIRRLFEQATLLPLRFGTQFRSEAVLLTHLQTSGSAYLEKLAYLTGKAEYTLKLTPLVAPEEPSVTTDLTGRHYFLAKKQRIQAHADQQQQRLHELAHLQAHIRQTYADHVLADAKEGIERIHLLSDRTAETDLQQQLSLWQEQAPHWQLSLSEGLPPYHFV